MRWTGFAVLLAVAVFSVGCAKTASQRGVVNHWRGESVDSFVVGETTQSEVLERLGPPSQVIRLEQGLIFYYLSEKTSGDKLFLLLYNTSNENTSYDRAIFFFDRDGLLTEVSFSRESLPYEDDG